MTEPHLLFEKRGHVALITLNRPHVRNAISPELGCRLADAFTEFGEDANLRVAIVTGAGDEAFCSGGDLALSMPLLTGARQPQDDWDRRFAASGEITDRGVMRNFEIAKPVIAAINGFCMAGGMELMLGTDIRLAVPEATFGLPEVRRALIPFGGSMVRLPRQISYANAMEILLVGDRIDAERALQIGLINHIVPRAQLLDRALEMAARIAENGPLAVRAVKETVLASSGLTLHEGYELEDAAKERVLASRDAREGPRAFIEKRPAVYEGR